MGGVPGGVTFDEMRDREIYAFEGSTNIHMEPNSAVREAAYSAWERGLLAGWSAAKRLDEGLEGSSTSDAAARWVTIQEAAALMTVHPRTVRRWIADRLIYAERMGPRLIRVDASSLEKMGDQLRYKDAP